MHLSIIVPVFNAQGFISQSLDTLDSFIRELAYDTELIIVDDGSCDRSQDIIFEWIQHKRTYATQLIPLGKNCGKGQAVARGMLAATGKYRVFLDADLAYPPSQILRIVEALEDGSHVAVACRVHSDSRYTISPAFFHYLYTRHLASRVINWLIRKTTIPHSRDSQAGLKGFQDDAANSIFSRQIISGFPFDVEALYLAEKMGFTIREVAVEYRYFNEPTTVVFLQDGLQMLKDILSVRLNHLLGRYNLPKKDGGKFLVVNADDFGMTLPIGRGILKTSTGGIVKSTSVMANSPDFETAMDEIVSSHAHFDVGLHATLTWGKPVLNPSEISTLVGKNGRFYSKSGLFIRALFKKISQDEVCRELHAQCERLAKRSPEISHLDSHHHVHVFPIVCKAVEKVAREFGIRFIRSPNEGLWSPWYKAFFRKFGVKLLSASRPAYWRSRGFLSTDHFGGFSLGAGDDLKKRWIETIERIPHGITEIMVHPGYESDNDDLYNKGREDELKVLNDNGILGAAAKANVKFISFRELLNL